MRGWRDKPYTKGRECFTAWGARKASDSRWQLWMPLILPDHLALEWIHPNANPKELSEKAVTDVLFEKAADI